MHEHADRDNPTKAVVLAESDDAFTIGGYGVVFGGEDLQGETFSKETDFWLDRLTRTPPVLYQHGRDDKLKHTVLGQAKIDDPDEVGLWVEAQIALSNQYADAIRKLLSEKKLGWSSGTAGHLAEREGSEIKSWPIVEMTLTPTPAEPRTLGVGEIRSLTEWVKGLESFLPEGAGDAPAEAEPETPAETIPEIDIVPVKETTMTEEIKGQEQAFDADAVAAKVWDALTKRIANEPAFEKALHYSPEQTDHPEEKSFGDFLVAVHRGDTKRLNSVYNSQKALATEPGESGGYLVPPEYSNDIMRIVSELSVVSPRARTIPMTTREWNYPVLNYTGGDDGTPASLGGVVATWTEEAGAKTHTEPSFEQGKLVYHELSGYTMASNMLRADAGPTLEAMLRQLFAEAIAWYEDWAFLRGDGVAKPLGVFNSPALVNYAAGATTFTLATAAGMLSKFLSRPNNNPPSPSAVWVMHPSLQSYLIQLADGSGAANNVIWIPNARENLPVSLFGRPVIFSEKMPTLPASASASAVGGVLLADFSYYLIGRRQGIQIDFSEHYRFINNQGTWRFVTLVDGQPWVRSSMTLADGSTTVSPFVSLAGA